MHGWSKTSSNNIHVMLDHLPLLSPFMHFRLLNPHYQLFIKRPYKWNTYLECVILLKFSIGLFNGWQKKRWNWRWSFLLSFPLSLHLVSLNLSLQIGFSCVSAYRFVWSPSTADSSGFRKYSYPVGEPITWHSKPKAWRK